MLGKHHVFFDFPYQRLQSKVLYARTDLHDNVTPFTNFRPCHTGAPGQTEMPDGGDKIRRRKSDVVRPEVFSATIDSCFFQDHQKTHTRALQFQEAPLAFVAAIVHDPSPWPFLTNGLIQCNFKVPHNVLVVLFPKD